MHTHEGYKNHERVVIFNELGGLLKGFIAVHNTNLGPAVGGCRMWNYTSPNEALSDCLRLSASMTYKNAMAGIPFGGGKAVIQQPKGLYDREALFHKFGEVIESMGGIYNTAIDVGTNLQDMRWVEERTEFVCGTKNTIASTTAKGCLQAILGLFDHMGQEIRGKTFLVQGLGQTGFALAELLHKAGGIIIACDLDYEKCDKAKEFGAEIVECEDIYDQVGDVFVPCALGGVINKLTIGRLRVWAICGTANNQIRGNQSDIWRVVNPKQIKYVPDYIANAGGVMHATAQLVPNPGFDLGEIGNRSFEILEKSLASILTTSEIADSLAIEAAGLKPGTIEW